MTEWPLISSLGYAPFIHIIGCNKHRSTGIPPSSSICQKCIWQISRYPKLIERVTELRSSRASKLLQYFWLCQKNFRDKCGSWTLLISFSPLILFSDNRILSATSVKLAMLVICWKKKAQGWIFFLKQGCLTSGLLEHQQIRQHQIPGG